MKRYLNTWAVALFLMVLSMPALAQGVKSKYNASFVRSAARKLDRSVAMPVTRADRQIRVADQGAFDALGNSIKAAVRGGAKTLEIVLAPGTYKYSEKHINLTNLKDVSIRMTGNSAILLPVGTALPQGRRAEVLYTKTYLDAVTLQPVDLWSEMQWCDGLVEILDKNTKACRLKVKDPSCLKNGKPARIHLTQSYDSASYPVDKVQGDYIYFTADDLTVVGDGYSVNQDYIDGQSYPRFKLFPETVTPTAPLYACETANFLTVGYSSFKDFQVSGIRFMGGKSGDYLIRMTSVPGKNIVFSDCEFAGIRTGVAYLENADDVTFIRNYFHDNYYYGISSTLLSSGTKILDNRFENNCFILRHSFCVKCVGTDFLISGNTFKNFCYGAVKIGYDYNLDMRQPSSGIVEYNEIWCDAEYNANPWKYTVMDGGAIYTATQSAGNIIRYNYIHDIPGMKSNRGIFLDDGSFNESVYGNVILRVMNSHCIDSRRVAGIEVSRRANSKVQRANVNNLIMYNVVDGTIRFVGREGEDNGCIKGVNYVLTGLGNQATDARVSGIGKNESDLEIRPVGLSGNTIRVSSADYKKLKKSPVWGYLKDFFTDK